MASANASGYAATGSTAIISPTSLTNIINNISSPDLNINIFTGVQPTTASIQPTNVNPFASSAMNSYPATSTNSHNNDGEKQKSPPDPILRAAICKFLETYNYEKSKTKHVMLAQLHIEFDTWRKTSEYQNQTQTGFGKGLFSKALEYMGYRKEGVKQPVKFYITKSVTTISILPVSSNDASNINLTQVSTNNVSNTQLMSSDSNRTLSSVSPSYTPLKTETITDNGTSYTKGSSDMSSNGTDILDDNEKLWVCISGICESIDDHTKDIENIQIEHANNINQLIKQYHQDIEQLKYEHKYSITQIQLQHKADIDRLESQHTSDAARIATLERQLKTIQMIFRNGVTAIADTTGTVRDQ